MAHDRAYLRAKSWSKAIRKRNIDRDTKPAHASWPDYYDNLHEYSKNKIHCSCPMCQAKTNGKNSWSGPSKNWKISDRRKIESLNEGQEEEEAVEND